MEKDDVKLIRSILSGDDTAFSDLVQKYQKSVHALAWRKIGDFQVAEEIAQDAFLQAYKKLATLKNPNQFAGWLYVIASNLCRDWHRRKKPTMQSLEATNLKTLEKTAYERYVTELREEAAAEQRQELVKNLLDKLPESERTVVTLHYLGEMTSEAISKFLGVSVNTIKSRLRRARKRLKEEEPMIRETLGSIQLPANFTENIMKKITNINLTPTPSGKPLLPWTALGSVAAFVILLMGASNQYLASFQKPYDLEAQSETTVEIVDTSVVLDIPSKPDLLRRVGSAVLTNNNSGQGQHVSNAFFAANEENNSTHATAHTYKWTQAAGPQSVQVSELFVTSKGTLLTVAGTGIYKMNADATEWVPVNTNLPTSLFSQMPIAERDGKLYLFSYREIFVSTDEGVTWNSVGPCPKGSKIELLTTDEAFYLVMDDEIFRSTDAGKHWTSFNDGLKDREITAAAVIENTVFVGTSRGIYRLKSGTWEQLPVGKFRTITSLAVSENTLYAGIVPDDSKLPTSELKAKLVRELMHKENSYSWEVYRSDDLGDSWKKITPQNKDFTEIATSTLGIKILAVGRTVLAVGLNTYRSKDGGETWTKLDTTLRSSYVMIDSPAVAMNENTFYRANFYSLERSTDAGESWHRFMKGIVGTEIRDLIAFKDILYAETGRETVYSTDGGETWTPVRIDSGRGDRFYPSKLTVANNSLYAIARDGNDKVRLCRLSESGDEFVPIPEIPAIAGDKLLKRVRKDSADIKSPSDDQKQNEKLRDDIRALHARLNIPRIGGLAVSGEVFYLESNSRLFKWTPGDFEWKDTGLDTGKDSYYPGFCLASSGETVYVGLKDGQLFQSVDGGKKWTDITSTLPISFKWFKEIVFAGSTVYVGTNKGVLASQSGKQWQILTDSLGRHIVVDCFAVDGKQVYGASDVGIIHLNDHGQWELISPIVPNQANDIDQVKDLVIHNGKFYIATRDRGMFHIPIKIQ